MLETIGLSKILILKTIKVNRNKSNYVDSGANGSISKFNRLKNWLGPKISKSKTSDVWKILASKIQ